MVSKAKLSAKIEVCIVEKRLKVGGGLKVSLTALLASLVNHNYRGLNSYLLGDALFDQSVADKSGTLTHDDTCTNNKGSNGVMAG